VKCLISFGIGARSSPVRLTHSIWPKAFSQRRASSEAWLRAPPYTSMFIGTKATSQWRYEKKNNTTFSLGKWLLSRSLFFYSNISLIRSASSSTTGPKYSPLWAWPPSPVKSWPRLQSYCLSATGTLFCGL
jgi:hypothetical protein